MLSQRTVVPPGFPELASDAELAGQLGTVLFGALLRLCHLAEPSRDVPGGWCTTLSADALAAALGVTRKTAAKWCADLVAAGLLVRVDGRRLGRGLGATPTRYFITAIAGLTVPSPDPRPTRGSSSRGKVSPEKSAQVIAYPVKAAPAVGTPVYARTDSPHPVVDVSSMNTHHDDPTVPTPTWLTESLRQIGFIGPLPEAITRDVPADKLMRVLEALRTRTGIDSPPRYLNWLLRSGPDAIDAFLADGPPADDTAGEPTMSTAEYVTLSDQFPRWKAAVLADAEQDAAARGIAVDLRVVLRAATALPLDEYYQEAQ
jgi:hypothetical protein